MSAVPDLDEIGPSGRVMRGGWAARDFQRSPLFSRAAVPASTRCPDAVDIARHHSQFDVAFKSGDAVITAFVETMHFERIDRGLDHL